MKKKFIPLKISTVALMFMPIVTMAATGPGISIDGSMAGQDTGLISSDSLSNISTIDGIPTAEFNGISVSFNQSTGQWEGTNPSNGSDSGVSSGVPSGPKFTVTSQCGSGTNADVTIQATLYDALSDYELYVDGHRVGTLNAGNRNFWNGQVHFTPTVLSLEGNRTYDIMVLDRVLFGWESWRESVTHTTPDCTQPLFCDLSTYSGDLNQCGTIVIPESIVTPIAHIEVSSTKVYIDQTPNVSYRKVVGTGGNACELQRQVPGGGWQNISKSDGSMVTIPQTLSSVGTWNYRAQCSGPSGVSDWVYASILAVYPPPTLNLSVRPTVPASIDSNKTKYKGTGTLSWNSTWTTGLCDASSQPIGFWSGSKPLNSSRDLSNELTAANTTFILSCLGLDGTRITKGVGLGVEYGTGAEIKVTCNTKTGDSIIVRKGETCRVEWKTGTSEPRYCVLRAGLAPFLNPLTTTEGSTTYTVNGEVTLFTDCEDGNNLDSVNVKVLPEFQET